MRIYGRDSLSWKKDKLMFERKVFGTLIPDSVYPSMFRIKFRDGEISPDFYNLTRAKDNAVKDALSLLNRPIENTPLETRRKALG